LAENESTSQYFVTNPGNNSQINAFITVLTVEFRVQPCQTYSLAMAIGDGSDSSLSSDVFMAANSFQSSGVEIIPVPTVKTQGGDSILFEGCGSVDVTLKRLDNVANADTKDLVIAGQAINGVDYTTIPDSIFFPAGVDSATISFSVIEDNFFEPVEDIIIGIADSTISLACGANGDSLILEINQRVPLQMDFSSVDTVNCTQQFHLFETQVDTGMLPYSYLWPTGDTTPSFNYVGTFAADTNFLVTITGACGVDTIVDTAKIIIQNPAISISSTDATITCENNGTTVSVQSFNTLSGMTYQWSSGQTTTSFIKPNPNESTDYIVTVTQDCAGDL